MRNKVSDVEYEKALAQWDAKIGGLSIKAHVPYMEPEDLRQELSLVLLKCMRAFDDTNGASFHTFFHAACWKRIFTMTRDINRHRGYGTENTVLYIDGCPLRGSTSGDLDRTIRDLVRTFSVPFDVPVELVLELQGFEGMEAMYVRGRMDLLSVAETARAYDVPELELRKVAGLVRSKIKRIRGGAVYAGN